MCKATLYVCGEHDNIRLVKIIRCEQALQGTTLRKVYKFEVNDTLPPLRVQGNCNSAPVIKTKIEPSCPEGPPSPGGTLPCPFSPPGKKDACHRR